jgi:O-antigen/teichoic acid export membrane protein
VSLGVLGVYTSQIFATGSGLLLQTVLLVSKHGHAYRPRFVPPERREFMRLSGVNYLTNIIGGLPAVMLPLLVVSRLGAEKNAVWSIVMLIASATFMLPSAISQALLSEGAHNPHDRMRLLRRSAVVLFLMLAPIILIGIVVAPYGLAIFGNEYRDGGTFALRIMLLSGFMVAGNYIAGAVLFFAKRVVAPLVVNTLNALLVLVPAATVATSLKDVATYWFLGEILNIVLFGATALLAARRMQAQWGKA